MVMTFLTRVGSALLAGYLTLPVSYADKPAPQLEQRVQVNVQSLESELDAAALQYGIYQGRYRVDSELMVRNPGQTIPGPLLLFYSLCFSYKERSACFDGKSEVLPSLSQEELKREIHLKMLRPSPDIEFVQGQKIPLSKATPKITIALQKNGENIYQVDHLLPPVAEYQCKNTCP